MPPSSQRCGCDTAYSGRVTTLVWFRDDLRITDHPALAAAMDDPNGVVALYVLDESSPGIRPLGGASKWWLHHSLVSLASSLAHLGVPLVLRQGAAATILPEVVQRIGVDRVLWNRRYGGAERQLDASLKGSLREQGIDARSYLASLLFEPGTILNQQGQPFRVYSPFWRACLAAPAPRQPLPAPTPCDPHATAAAQRAAHRGESETLAAWHLLPRSPDWAAEFPWQPGEQTAAHELTEFLAHRAHRYAKERDVPAAEVTSGLAPHLRFGEISPNQVWHAARDSGADVTTFLSEVGWREFAWHTLFHAPDLAERNFDPRFDRFPWAEADPDTVQRWQQGRTGVPLVDAGMRELWRSGTMHNRVRMVVASFLVKNLLIDWRVGEQWFWDTLVDADAAANPFNWQWVAGSGTDAAPYFRVFNPELQRQKFDSNGAYVDRWAPDSLLNPPMVDLRASRARALEAFAHMQDVAAEGHR